jgi:ankyrin repeat protein
MNISKKITLFLLLAPVSGNVLWATQPQKHLFNHDEETSYLRDVNNLRDLLETKELNVNAHDQAGRTLLIAAIEANKLDVIELLVENGVNIDLGIDCAEQPPLHCAIWNFHSDIVEFLLDHGTEHINSPDSDGTLPLCTAAHGGKLINDIDDETITPEDLQTYLPVCQEMIRLLVSRGADINGKNTPGETALHEAVTWGLPELAKTLIDLGADINAQDSKGKTPLDYAYERDNQEIISILTQPIHA